MNRLMGPAGQSQSFAVIGTPARIACEADDDLGIARFPHWRQRNAVALWLDVQLVGLEHWAAASRQGESSSGNVSLFYEGKTFRAFAGGNGPVDALLSAVDNALEQIIDGRPQLVDYQLRSIGSGEDAQGEATVKISAPAGDGDVPQVFTGHGLSTNVVEASLRAYIAAVNKLIAEHPVAAEAVQAARDRRASADPVTAPAGSRS